jgi:lysophospholipase L1-like esterase
VWSQTNSGRTSEWPSASRIEYHALAVRILRALGARCLLLLAGLVAGLLALEACLQLGALVVGLYHPDTNEASFSGAEKRLVCLGDSNTYGLYVGKERAYPQVLEQIWNRSTPDNPIRVLNLGYPGNNTSVLRNRLPDVLRLHQPDAVTLMIGANDLWTLPESIGVRDWLWRHSRVFRLLFMVRRSWEGPPEEHMPGVEGDYRWAPTVFQSDWEVQVARNLTAMVSDIRAAGSRPILLTYPSSAPVYAHVNLVIRRVAAAATVDLIDLTPTFDLQCPKHECVYFVPDHHPSAAGHHLAGSLLARQLQSRRLVPGA